MREKGQKKTKEKKHNKKIDIKRRLRQSFAAAAIVVIFWAGAMGLIAVDTNTRRTGLSYAPGFVEMEEVAPREYRLEIMGGQYSFTFKLPSWV